MKKSFLFWLVTLIVSLSLMNLGYANNPKKKNDINIVNEKLMNITMMKKSSLVKYSGAIDAQGKPFARGIAEGLIDNKPAWVYIGFFKDGKIEGQGTLEFPSIHLKLEGDFKNGDLDGKGKVFQNGLLSYEGDFKNGERHGYGKMYEDGKLIFEGKFANNDPQYKAKEIVPKVIQDKIKSLGYEILNGSIIKSPDKSIEVIYPTKYLITKQINDDNYVGIAPDLKNSITVLFIKPVYGDVVYNSDDNVVKTQIDSFKKNYPEHANEFDVRKINNKWFLVMKEPDGVEVFFTSTKKAKVQIGATSKALQSDVLKIVEDLKIKE